MAKIITRPAVQPAPGPIASPPPTPPPSASGSDTGQIVLAGLLTTYLGAPIGCRDSSQYEISKEYSSTTQVSVTNGSGIVITNAAGIETPGTGGAFSFNAGTTATYTQSSSNQVTNGITLTRSMKLQLNTPPPGLTGNTLFIGLLRPTIELSGPPNNVRFKILKAEKEFSVTAADIQNGSVFDPVTSASFLAQYPLLADPAGSSLVKPRFKLKLNILLSAGSPTVYTFTKSSASQYMSQLMSSSSVEIVNSVGFSIGIFKETFSIGKTLSVTQTNSQENVTTKTLTLSTTLNRNALGVSQVYYDRLFNTFVVVDAGPPMPAVAQGRVTDAQGNAIPGAVVKLTQGGTDYAGVSDASGNYSIALAAGASLAPGASQISCGNVSKSVTTGRTAVRADFAGVVPVAARARNFTYLDL